MDKYQKYYGLIVFCIAVLILILGLSRLITPKVEQSNLLKQEISNKNEELRNKKTKLEIVQKKIKRIKQSIFMSQKKIYTPVEADLGNDTLFFTLYNDIIEMLQSNSVKIKSIAYSYNPETDAFVKFGKEVYFVCDVNMELVANYINLGKFIQDVYQYPYYIRINEIDVNPYPKDKRILIANISLRLYAHTSPDESIETESMQQTN